MTSLGPIPSFASSGPQGDRTYFMEYIQKNIHLYRLRNSVKLSPFAAASFTRSELARMLRSSPHQVDLLCAGYDEKSGPKLFYIDYLSAMGDVKRAAHGCGAGSLSLDDVGRLWLPSTATAVALHRARVR